MLYSTLDPIFEFHKEFLSILEHRVAEWESEERSGKKIGDVLFTQMKKFSKFETSFDQLEGIMHEIESSLQLYPRFLQVWRSFESRKLCYLPISNFFIKPISRLFQYYSAIGRMERREGNAALNELAGPVKKLRPVLQRSLQFQIMSQLQRELVGAERLVRTGREFIREGNDFNYLFYLGTVYCGLRL
jgi:FERM/RhoGEF/pleckstrin domain protein 2